MFLKINIRRRRCTIIGISIGEIFLERHHLFMFRQVVPAEGTDHNVSRRIVFDKYSLLIYQVTRLRLANPWADKLQPCIIFSLK